MPRCFRDTGSPAHLTSTVHTPTPYEAVQLPYAESSQVPPEAHHTCYTPQCSTQALPWPSAAAPQTKNPLVESCVKWSKVPLGWHAAVPGAPGNLVCGQPRYTPWNPPSASNQARSFTGEQIGAFCKSAVALADVVPVTTPDVGTPLVGISNKFRPMVPVDSRKIAPVCE